MDLDSPSKEVEHRNAPWFNVPRVPVIGIEHPYLISDIGKAIQTLGGSELSSKLVGEESASIEASLYLHPANRESKPIASFNTKTTDVLIRITVPKRTGRKRKRGTDGEFLGLQPPSSSRPLLSDPDDAQRLFRAMRDNTNRYRIDVIGSVKQTHRFRHPKLKDFKFDMSKGVQEKNDLLPPPQWTRHTIPLNYSYREKSGLKPASTSAGLSTVSDPRAAQRIKIFMVTWDAPSVPTAPSEDLPSESALLPSLQSIIAAVRELFTRRPICTRRVVQNSVPADIWKAVGPNTRKQIWQYVGFIWSSGPWRDTICAFGVDPRKDRAMRQYQTVVFQFDPEPMIRRADGVEISKVKMDSDLAAKAEVRDGHVFDGSTVRLDGKVWQMCDIADPLLKLILGTEHLREECEMSSDGWYANGALAKIKVIMKTKMLAILAGGVDNEHLDDELLRLHEKIPDVLNEENRAEAIFEKGTASSRMVKWAEAVRLAATRPGGRNAPWGPKTAKQKADAMRLSATKKKVVFGLGKEQDRDQRTPQKEKGKTKENRQMADHGDMLTGQELIDPRLRGIIGSVDSVERKEAMRAFEADVEGSNDEDSVGEGSTTDSSDTEESDTEGSDAEESNDEDSDVDDSDTSGKAVEMDESYRGSE